MACFLHFFCSFYEYIFVGKKKTFFQFSYSFAFFSLTFQITHCFLKNPLFLFLRLGNTFYKDYLLFLNFFIKNFIRFPDKKLMLPYLAL